MKIRVSFGDAVYVGQAVTVAVRKHDWRVIRQTLWVLREERRRDAWLPFTLGQYLALRRRRRGVR